MIISAAAALAVWLITADPLSAVSIFVLGLIWSVLPEREGPPVLAMALTLQWIQVTIGMFYVGLTGRPLEATLRSDYRPMVAIGLGCIVALLAGLWCGQRWVDRLGPPTGERPQDALAFKTLGISYAAAVAVVGAVQQLAWSFPE